jgi:hypothetical protein
MRYIGIDPGKNLGVVCVDVFNVERRIGSVPSIRWVGTTRIHPGSRSEDTPAENEGRLFSRLCMQFDEWQKYIPGGTEDLRAVLEEPYTHGAQWHGERAQAHGTSFGLGKYYGLALAACTFKCVRVYSHPPTNDAKRQRTGWMQGSGRIQKRELTLLALRGLIRQCGCQDPNALSEDEVMAFGVLKFHLDRFGIDGEGE